MGVKNLFWSSLVFSLLLVLPGCGSHPVKPSLPSVSIVQTDSRQTIAYAQLLNEISDADYLLLGEEHDQALHHSKRADLIRSLAASNPLLVSFEHIDEDDQALLKANIDKPEELRSVLGWDDSGWPEWRLFLPLFKAVAETKAEVVAGMRSSSGEFSEYGLTSVLPSQTKLEKLLRDSHPATVKFSLERMILAQRKRDAGMASSLDLVPTPGEPKRIKILLAGNGHVRKDFGVPWYLAFRHPQAKIVSVGFITNGEQDTTGIFDFVFLFE